MKIRTVFFLAALLPLQVLADKGDFIFKVADSVNVIPPSCVRSLEYQAEDEMNSESIYFSLTTDCGKHLSHITRQYIGKTAHFLYRDNVLSSALIVSVIGSNFRISSKEIPRAVLMQMLRDYGVATE